MHNLATMTIEDQCHALQLWGTSGLLNMEVQVESVQWPNNRRCHELLEIAQADHETMNLRTAQFWLGLRRMAQHRSDVVTVAAQAGDQILELWTKSTTETERQETLNRWMIDWLERCAAADWTLLPDYKPLVVR